MTTPAYHRSLSLQGRGTARASEGGEGVNGRGKTPDHLLALARKARQNMTEAEDKLWARLRGRRLGGFKFRRQEPLGDARPDFVCPAAKLIVEVDGSQHVDAASADARRSRVLNGEGYRVMRVWNNDVIGRIDAVLEAILAALSPPHPAPLARRCPSPLQGEGE